MSVDVENVLYVTNFKTTGQVGPWFVIRIAVCIVSISDSGSAGPTSCILLYFVFAIYSISYTVPYINLLPYCAILYCHRAYVQRRDGSLALSRFRPPLPASRQELPPHVNERTVPTPTHAAQQVLVGASREDPRARHATSPRARIYSGAQRFVFGDRIHRIMHHYQPSRSEL